MFGRKKNAFATYSKSKPVQIATKDHFPTPETPDDLWIPSSKDKPNSKQAAFPPVKAKGLKTWMTPFAGRGSSLALRNISNIPLEKTLSRTPCMPSQNSYKTNRKLMSSSALLGKVSSNDDKDCKTYRKELQRAKLHSKKAPLMKSKPLTSTTTYSFKSMSSCSMCGSVVCSNERSLSTVKSMSLCKSCLDDVNSDDFSFGDAPTSASQVLQPHNSTLLEEDLTIQLRDIIPQDLSAIMEEPVDEKEQAEAAQKKTEDALGSYDLFDKEEIADAPDLPRCSTPVDPGKIQGLKLPDTSAITVYNEKTSDPVKSKSKSKSEEPESSKEDLPNVTPETVSKQDCITMKKLKQKRKLAYSKDLDEIPDCTLLHANTNRKRPIKLLFKCDKSTCSYSSPLTNVPIDTLIQSSVDKIKIRIEQ